MHTTTTQTAADDLRAAVRTRLEAERALRDAAQAAHRAGLPWREIAEICGISRQTAMSRYAERP